ELETDKATIEVPSTVTGRIREVKVNVGDNVKVGQTILVVEDGAAQASPGRPIDAKEEPAGSASKDEAASQPAEAKPAGGQSATRAGTGRAAAQAPENDEPLEERAPTPRQAPGERAARSKKVVEITRGARPVLEQAPAELPAAPAAPSVRRLARELGVDIDQVPG